MWILRICEEQGRHWTRDRFIKQMEQAMEIAENKYPKEVGWRHACIFDHSSCHAAMADVHWTWTRWMSSLRGNNKSWGAWHGTYRFVNCIIKRRMEGKWQKDWRWFLKVVVYQWYSTVDGEHSCSVLWFPRQKEHGRANAGWKRPISRISFQNFIWSSIQLKDCVPSWNGYPMHTLKYSLPSLHKNIPLVHDSLTLKNIQNHFR